MITPHHEKDPRPNIRRRRIELKLMEALVSPEQDHHRILQEIPFK